jgi:hypothetical protein
MKLAIFLFALMCSILFAGQVTAEKWVEQVTPKKTARPGDTFTIKVQRLKQGQGDEVLEVHVAVKLDDSIKMPVRQGLLLVYNGKEFVSSCEVEPTVRDEERSFSFRIAAKYAEKSRFTYSESNRDSIGYWFYMQDFVPSK